MRTWIAAMVAAAVIVLTPAPVEAHQIRCQAYVGNPCYKTAAMHVWLHRILANPFILLGGR